MCRGGGRGWVGWCAPMCVGGVGALGGARFRGGGVSCICTPRARACARTHGGCACAGVPWRERVSACAAGLRTAVAAHIWPRMFIYVVRKARSSARTHSRAGRPSARRTRVGSPCPLRARSPACSRARSRVPACLRPRPRLRTATTLRAVQLCGATRVCPSHVGACDCARVCSAALGGGWVQVLPQRNIFSSTFNRKSIALSL